MHRRPTIGPAVRPAARGVRTFAARGRWQLGVLGLAAALTASGCATEGSRSSNDRLQVVAATAVWGGLAEQVAGPDADVRTLVDNPDADPHDYEPSVADAREVDRADVLVLNGAGYDTWAATLAQAASTGDRRTVSAAEVTGTAQDANPHLWYSPAAVEAMVAAMADTFAAADPTHAEGYQQRREEVIDGSLAEYLTLIDQIRAEHADAAIAATESIMEPLATDLGLRLITPPALLAAISEGVEPSVSDRREALAQIESKQVTVLVYNKQNSTPDVEVLVAAAKSAGIPVVAVTETPPRGTSFGDWQVEQLTALLGALSR